MEKLLVKIELFRDHIEKRKEIIRESEISEPMKAAFLQILNDLNQSMDGPEKNLRVRNLFRPCLN